VRYLLSPLVGPWIAIVNLLRRRRRPSAALIRM
jgi:hypothetical protein